MAQHNKNIIGIVATIIGVLSLFLSSLVTVFSFVDPVGLMYAYFAIPFVLFSLVFSNKGWLIAKLFAVLFVLSHCIAFWTIRDIEEKSNVVKYSKSFNEDTFIKCSETMFKDMNGNQKQLTSQQQSNFDNCLNNNDKSLMNKDRL